MITFKGLSTFLIAASMATALGCASSTKQQTAGSYIDDSWITTKVKTEILNEPSLKVNQIGVETTKNVVHLSGSVDSAASMNKAVAIARSVKGVTSVKNDLQVR